MSIRQLDPQPPLRTGVVWTSRRRKRWRRNSVGRNLEDCTPKPEESCDAATVNLSPAVSWIYITEPASSLKSSSLEALQQRVVSWWSSGGASRCCWLRLPGSVRGAEPSIPPPSSSPSSPPPSASVCSPSNQLHSHTEQGGVFTAPPPHPPSHTHTHTKTYTKRLMGRFHPAASARLFKKK